jgi:hypothetical protein
MAHEVRTVSAQITLKHAFCSALVALLVVLAFASGGAGAADGCAPYGDERTDFTWLLCPGGKKYERQYRYFGIWSEFYTVGSDVGACSWSAPRSSWMCPEMTIKCDARRCTIARHNPAGALSGREHR